ncbi:hypothetical protein [Limnospira platensis]|uniref:hypothetical protein n=1 Tax=Limnospira platensis TaxID=118562 RepID=UPI003D6DE646
MSSRYSRVNLEMRSPGNLPLPPPESYYYPRGNPSFLTDFIWTVEEFLNQGEIRLHSGFIHRHTPGRGYHPNFTPSPPLRNPVIEDL